MTFDRINNESHYEPSNCHWATRKEQRKNRRGPWASGLTAFGRTQTLAEWAAEFGINRWTLKSRVYQAGHTLEEALTIHSEER